MQNGKLWFVMFVVIITATKVHAATLVIVNQSPRPLAIHPVLNTQDEYVTHFKYSVAPGTAVTYRSGIYPIKGIRWKKTRVNRDGNSFITVDYITKDMPTVPFYNDNALIEIYENDRYEYYPNKHNVKHYFEKEGALVASNLYQKVNGRFILQNAGIDVIPSDNDLNEWIWVKN